MQGPNLTMITQANIMLCSSYHRALIQSLGDWRVRDWASHTTFNSCNPHSALWYSSYSEISGRSVPSIHCALCARIRLPHQFHQWWVNPASLECTVGGEKNHKLPYTLRTKQEDRQMCMHIFSLLYTSWERERERERVSECASMDTVETEIE